MKKKKKFVCFIERIVMPSAMFMIPSIKCCKLPSPAFWIAKRHTLSRTDNAYLTWTKSILLFVNVQEIFYPPNDSIRVRVKGKIIIRGVGYGLEIPAEYTFYGNEKAIQWAKRTLDDVYGNVKKKFQDV